MSGLPGQASGGWNKKPAGLHAIQGTLRRDRHGATSDPERARAATGRVRIPRPPEGLSDASRALWRQFHREYDLTSAPALELLTAALRSRDVAERARDVLDREGVTIADSAGRPKAHPAAAIFRDSQAAYVTVIRALNLETN